VTNLLGQEKSPYLLQHRDNPVNWYPWGEKAFEAARREQKPIFLSIGYSTCYWCHVMEKDSFEYQDVADLLNEWFISIKVDREERPDIDQIYMDAVTGMTGHGGWPLTVFLTPDLAPFWGATFFYKDQFKQVLRAIHNVWVNEREKVISSSEKIARAVGDLNLHGEAVDKEAITAAFAHYSSRFDSQFGGFGGAPKFPPSMQISFLLRVSEGRPSIDSSEQDREHALYMACFTLEHMARGGMYDQLGGGFHRYSVDERWLVPHFEKMLYDNALLPVAYLEAYQLTKTPLFAQIARETLNFCLDLFRAPEGGFYSALDAGEVGKEGEYYVWREDEVRELLNGEEFDLIEKVYGITKQGNFEHGTNVLSLQKPYGVELNENPVFIRATRKLLQARETRERPHRDEKVLTSWNALLITALCRGWRVLHEDRYLTAARDAARFILGTLTREGRLLHRYSGGEAGIEGLLEDYAYFIEALLELYQCDFDEHWLREARRLQRIQDEMLWSDERGGYFTTSAAEVYVRKRDVFDNATPSGNSVSILNLVKLNLYFAEPALRDKAFLLLQSVARGLDEFPYAFPKALLGVQYLLDERAMEVVVASNHGVLEGFWTAMDARFNPHLIRAMTRQGADDIALLKGRSATDGKPSIYICREGSCELPVEDLGIALERLTER